MFTRKLISFATVLGLIVPIAASAVFSAPSDLLKIVEDGSPKQAGLNATFVVDDQLNINVRASSRVKGETVADLQGRFSFGINVSMSSPYNVNKDPETVKVSLRGLIVDEVFYFRIQDLEINTSSDYGVSPNMFPLGRWIAIPIDQSELAKLNSPLGYSNEYLLGKKIAEEVYKEIVYAIIDAAFSLHNNSTPGLSSYRLKLRQDFARRSVKALVQSIKKNANKIGITPEQLKQFEDTMADIPKSELMEAEREIHKALRFQWKVNTDQLGRFKSSSQIFSLKPEGEDFYALARTHTQVAEAFSVTAPTRSMTIEEFVKHVENASRNRLGKSIFEVGKEVATELPQKLLN